MHCSAADFVPKHSIELLVFTSEEPTRFGIGCLGSRCSPGRFLPTRRENRPTKTARQWTKFVAKLGWTANSNEVKLPNGYYKAFVELHIEQGPLLEREQIPLGLVTNIAAPASFGILVEGAGGHAGGVLMPDRHDALCAAAELILAIENAARTSGADRHRRDGWHLRSVSWRSQQHSQPGSS